MISTEAATVYRGGGRRWFTLKAAAGAEVRAKLKTRCECDGPEARFIPGYPPVTCCYHNGSDRAAKIKRRLTRIYMAAYRATKENTHE